MQNVAKLKSNEEHGQTQIVAETIEAALGEVDVAYTRSEHAFAFSVGTDVKTHELSIFAIEDADHPRHMAIINPDVLGARLPTDPGVRSRVLENALALNTDLIGVKLCVWRKQKLILMIQVPLEHSEPSTDLVQVQVGIAIAASDRVFQALAPIMWGEGDSSTVH